MDESAWLAERFEEHRARLRAVAYRMLGSLSDAEDAVQEAWLRFSRADAGSIENMAGFLTTVVANVSLNMLRSRSTRKEQPLGVRLPDPVVSGEDETDDVSQEIVMAESIGLALLVVLDTMSPGERLAFVLHDMFAMPFDEIAPIVGRSPAAARQLASRARRRVQDTVRPPDTDLPEQRRLVDAFLAAARKGDFDALVAVLDPDVVVRVDGGSSRPRLTGEVRGAADVAEHAVIFGGLSAHMHPMLVNGGPGVVVAPRGEPVSLLAFTVRAGRITEIDILADPERLQNLDLPVRRGRAGERPSP